MKWIAEKQAHSTLTDWSNSDAMKVLTRGTKSSFHFRFAEIDHITYRQIFAFDYNLLLKYDTDKHLLPVINELNLYISFLLAEPSG